MTQAIGRIRRFGQRKHVHIWHILAIGTVDVDVMQMRRDEVLVKTGSAFGFMKKKSVVGLDWIDLGGHIAETERLFGKSAI
jgi:hypothetical protein